MQLWYANTQGRAIGHKARPLTRAPSPVQGLSFQLHTGLHSLHSTISSLAVCMFKVFYLLYETIFSFFITFEWLTVCKLCVCIRTCWQRRSRVRGRVIGHKGSAQSMYLKWFKEFPFNILIGLVSTDIFFYLRCI